MLFLVQYCATPALVRCLSLECGAPAAASLTAIHTTGSCHSQPLPRIAYDEVTSRLKPTVSEASGAVESIALPAAWSLNLSPKCRCRKALP